MTARRSDEVILTPIWDFVVYGRSLISEYMIDLGHNGFNQILISVTMQLCLQFEQNGSKNRTIIKGLVGLIKV